MFEVEQLWRALAKTRKHWINLYALSLSFEGVVALHMLGGLVLPLDAIASFVLLSVLSHALEKIRLELIIIDIQAKGLYYLVGNRRQIAQENADVRLDDLVLVVVFNEGSSVLDMRAVEVETLSVIGVRERVVPRCALYRLLWNLDSFKSLDNVCIFDFEAVAVSYVIVLADDLVGLPEFDGLEEVGQILVH